MCVWHLHVCGSGSGGSGDNGNVCERGEGGGGGAAPTHTHQFRVRVDGRVVGNVVFRWHEEAIAGDVCGCHVLQVHGPVNTTTFVPMPRTKRGISAQRQHILRTACGAEADACGVVKAHVEARVSALVRHEVSAVEEQGRVVKHALEVDKGGTAVGAPRTRQVEMLAVPRRVARQVSVVEILRVVGEVGIPSRWQETRVGTRGVILLRPSSRPGSSKSAFQKL